MESIGQMFIMCFCGDQFPYANISWHAIPTYGRVTIISRPPLPPSLLPPQFECCGWVNTTLWLSSPYYETTMMFPPSCECGNDTSADTVCMDFNDQIIYNEVCD